MYPSIIPFFSFLGIQYCSILDTWIARCQQLPHFTDRPFLYCAADDIASAAQKGKDEQQIKDLSTLAIRAPPGGVLEVHDPFKTHSDPKKRRYQLSVYNKTGISDLPLPPPPSGDETFKASKRKERMTRTNLDLGDMSGVGGTSGNPVQVFHIRRSSATSDNNIDTAMEINGDHATTNSSSDGAEQVVKLRKIFVDDTLAVRDMCPVGFDGDTRGIVTPEMIMGGNYVCGKDALCLMEDEGASTFFT